MDNVHWEFAADEKIQIVTYLQGDIDFHRHDFLEMAYIQSGRALHTLNNAQTTLVEKGDYFIIDYGAIHKYTLINDERFDIINILFKPELIDKTLYNCRSFQDLIQHYLIRVSYASLEKNPTHVIFRDNDLSVYKLIEQMQNEYTGKEPGYMELIRCHLIEIFILTTRTISKKASPVIQNDTSKYIADTIDKNYMKPITLSEICTDLNFSLPYICRKFKQDTGYTFIAYLQKKRMEQSGRLLANTDKKISEIADLVGYQDIKFFNTVFKKHWGKTPREFRSAYR